MKNVFIIAAVLFLAVSFLSCKQENSGSPYEDKIEDLLTQMTVEEKVGQTAQFTLDVIGEGEDVFSSHFPFKLDEVMLEDVLVNRKTGSLLQYSVKLLYASNNKLIA